MAYKMKGSPFQRNFGVGRTEAPEKESPLNQNTYKERQLAKAEKLHAKADKREYLTKVLGRKRFGTGKYARKRAEIAVAKAAAGSREQYKFNKLGLGSHVTLDEYKNLDWRRRKQAREYSRIGK